MPGPQKCPQSHHWLIKISEYTPPEPKKVIFITVGDNQIPLELTRQARSTPISTADFNDVAEAPEDPASPNQETYASVLRRKPGPMGPTSPQAPTPTAFPAPMPQDPTNNLPPLASHSLAEEPKLASPNEGVTNCPARSAPPPQTAAQTTNQDQLPQAPSSSPESVQDQSCPSFLEKHAQASAKEGATSRSARPAPQSETDAHAATQDPSTSPESQAPGPLPPTPSKPKRQTRSIEDLTLPKKIKDRDSPHLPSTTQA